VLIPVELEKKPVLLCPTVINEFIFAEAAPSVLVLRILHTDIFVATPRVLVLIPPLLERSPVLVSVAVVVAPSVVPPADSVVILAVPAPRVLVLRILQTDIFVATPRVLVLILPLLLIVVVVSTPPKSSDPTNKLVM
jgi:hypothetical protein